MMDFSDDFGHLLYSDEYVELYEEILIIKRYFFPLMKPKVIRLKDLRIAYYDDQSNGKYASIRTWGKGGKEVYWAVDFRRCLPGDKCGKSNVIIDIEDGLKKGFTVKDAEKFFDSIRNVAPMSLIVVDNLNV